VTRRRRFVYVIKLRTAILPESLAVYVYGEIKFKEEDMLSWTITFLVIALVAALLGFGGIAGAAAGIAKILFFVFLIAFVVTLVLGRRPVV
jgi:uncharacterized membrane protein YtjA (UPF0391 family)